MKTIKMKVSHLYFDKYCTRNVTFENTPGLFHVNGEPIQREVLEELSMSRSHRHDRKQLPEFGKSTVVSALTSPSKDLTVVPRKQKETVSKPHPLHPEEISEIRAKEVAKLKHIYHDDNFVRINRESKEHIVTGKRTWLGSNNLYNHTVACMTGVVQTEVPQNRKQLGLTPLRQYGHGQDKPHHVMPTNDSRRMKI